MVTVIWAIRKGDELSQDKKWAEKLGLQCGLSPAFLKHVLEELNESCHGDATTSKEIIEELTLSCHLDEEELRRFVGEVSKNCPFEAKKIKEEVLKAEGDKNKLWEGARWWAQYRGGAR
jgi:Cft2 family RNA processing exonuclease